MIPRISPHRALLLFARLPELGRVKTRLSPRFTPEEALALHRALLMDSLDLMQRAAEASQASLWLYLSAAGELDAELAPHLGPCRVHTQRGADLGERLRHAFQERFAAGAERVVVLGSDSPHLPAALVVRAFAELERSEVVLGPARDGGYYLLAASRFHPTLFAAIPWGTPQVYRETVRRARQQEIPIVSLPAWNDVDTPEATVQLWEDLARRRAAGSPEIPAACFTLLEAWARQGKLGQGNLKV